MRLKAKFCFLDNDTEIIQSQWLDVLLQQVMRPEVGLVGPRLEYYDGRIQHGGFILGVNDGVENVFDGYNSAEPGYLFYLNNVRNVSALSSSCLMIRKMSLMKLVDFLTMYLSSIMEMSILL